MSWFSLLIVILVLSSLTVGQLLQGSACIGAIRASDQDSNGFLTIVEFGLLAAFSEDDCSSPSITDTTRFNTLSDGTASINIQTVYLNEPGFIETSLMNVVCINAFSSPYTCQGNSPTVSATASPIDVAPVTVPSPPQPQAPPVPTGSPPQTFPGCFNALESADEDNSDSLDFDEFLVLVDIVLDCSTLLGAPVRTFYENAVCLCPNGSPQCCNANAEIDITNNQDRICTEAYSLRLFATINPAGCPSPTPAPTTSPTSSPSRSPVTNQPTRAPLPTNQPFAPTTQQPIVGTAVPTDTPPTDIPTTFSPTLTFVSSQCLDRLDDADANNDGFIDISEFPFLSNGRACEVTDWNSQAYEIFQDLANCSPNCPIVTATLIPLDDRSQLERICQESRNAVVCITDAPTQSPTTLAPTMPPTVTPPTATTPCENLMRNADANQDQKLSLPEFTNFLFRLADCRSPTNFVIVETIFITSGCECRRLQDPECCSAVEFVDISVLFQPRNDTTRDYITAVCTASQAINAFVGSDIGECPPTESPTLRPTQSPVVISAPTTIAPTPGDAPTVVQQTFAPAQPIAEAPTFAPIDGAPLGLCETSLLLGNADGDLTMTADEFALFLFYLGDCATILRNNAFVQAFRASISSCAVLGLPGSPCFVGTDVIDIASLYVDVNLRSAAQSGQINTICSISLGALAGGQIVDSSVPVGCTEPPTKFPSQAPTTLTPTLSPTIQITNSPTQEIPDPQLESCVAQIGPANIVQDNFLSETELLVLANTLSACTVQENSIFLQFLFASFACDCATDFLCCFDGIAKIDVTGYLVPFSLRTIPQRRRLESFCASLLSIVDPEGAICPTAMPTSAPTILPTRSPTAAPSRVQTNSPTLTPTKAPSSEPIDPPTQFPVRSPTESPQTFAPIANGEPTRVPIVRPTAAPVPAPTPRPIVTPVTQPTTAPLNQPPPSMAPLISPNQSPFMGPNPIASPVSPPLFPQVPAPPIVVPVVSPTTNPVFNPASSPISIPIPAPVPVPVPVPMFSFRDCIDAIRAADEDGDSRLDQDEYRSFIVVLSDCELISRLSDIQFSMFQELACLCEFDPTRIFPDCCIRVNQQLVSVAGVYLGIGEMSNSERSSLQNVCDQTRSVIPPGCAPSPTNTPTAQPVDGPIPTRGPIPGPVVMPSINQSPSSPMVSQTTKPVVAPSVPNAAQPISQPGDNPTPSRTNAPIVLVRETDACRAFFDEDFRTADGLLTKERFFAFVEQLSGCRYNDNDLPIPLRAVFDELGQPPGDPDSINLRGMVDDGFVDRRAQVCYEIGQAIGGTSCEGLVTDPVVPIPESELQLCTNAMVQADNGDEKLDRVEFQSFLSFYGDCVVDDLDFGNYVSFYSFACNCEGEDFVCCFPIATVNVSGASLASKDRSSDQSTRLAQVCDVANGLINANQTSCEPLPEIPDPSVGDKECSDLLISADGNGDERLSRDEFRTFLQLRFPESCGDIETIPHYQSIIFNSLSCACLFESIGNIFCCLPQSAAIQLSGVNTTITSRDRYERGTIATLCEATLVASEFGCAGPKEIASPTAITSTTLLERATSVGLASGATKQIFPAFIMASLTGLTLIMA